MTDVQKRAVDFCLARDAALIFARPGKGKTRIALDIISHTDANKVLIIAPLLPALTSWPDENKKWGYNFDMRVLHGKEKKTGDEYISVINPGGLDWLMQQDLTDYDFIIYDEIHLFKTAGTIRFRRWRKFMSRFHYKLGLTGTPVSNKLQDLWGPTFCMDAGKRLETTHTRFIGKYFYPHPYIDFKWVAHTHSESQIFNNIKDISLALDTEPGDLPKLTHCTIPIPLSVSARKMYEQMKKNNIIESTDVVAVNAAVKTAKLKQIAAGNVYDIDRNVVKMHDAKQKHLSQLVDSLQSDPLLVFFEFKHDKKSMLECLRSSTVEVIDATTSSEQLIDIIKRFNAGKIDVLLGQAQKAGIGGNMQAVCANICFYTMPWSLSVVEQCIGRVWRMGQSRDVVVHYLACEDTIDFKIIEDVKGKKVLQDKLFEVLG